MGFFPLSLQSKKKSNNPKLLFIRRLDDPWIFFLSFFSSSDKVNDESLGGKLERLLWSLWVSRPAYSCLIMCQNVSANHNRRRDSGSRSLQGELKRQEKQVDVGCDSAERGEFYLFIY